MACYKVVVLYRTLEVMTCDIANQAWLPPIAATTMQLYWRNCAVRAVWQSDRQASMQGAQCSSGRKGKQLVTLGQLHACAVSILRILALLQHVEVSLKACIGIIAISNCLYSHIKLFCHTLEIRRIMVWLCYCAFGRALQFGLLCRSNSVASITNHRSLSFFLLRQRTCLSCY